MIFRKRIRGGGVLGVLAFSNYNYTECPNNTRILIFNSYWMPTMFFHLFSSSTKLFFYGFHLSSRKEICSKDYFNLTFKKVCKKLLIFVNLKKYFKSSKTTSTIKGNVRVNLSDPSSRDGTVRFTRISWKPLSHHLSG